MKLSEMAVEKYKLDISREDSQYAERLRKKIRYILGYDGPIDIADQVATADGLKFKLSLGVPGVESLRVYTETSGYLEIKSLRELGRLIIVGMVRAEEE